MSISEAWNEMQTWMEKYVDQTPLFLILTAAAAIYLFAVNKSVRKKILVTLLLLVPIVINPVLYKFVYHKLRYWRLFWILPEAVLIGLAFADISTRINRQWIKCICLAGISLVMIFGGKYAFSTESDIQPMDNIYKVSKIVKQNCDIILADNPTPKCIFQHGMCETRQYSGNIMQLYGRDANGYIIKASKDALKVDSCWHVDPEGQEYIFQYAEENGYTHICCDTELQFDEMAKAHGFSVLSEKDGTTIYHKE